MNDTPSISVLIRFANSEATLPGVLAALKRQTIQPQRILGVSSHSTDRSRALMRDAGAEIIEWTERYAHSRVLNFGLCHLDTDLVLVLSSHTVLESPDTLEKMADCFRDDRVACVSLKWDDDPFYSDAVTWTEIKAKGLRFGSIYSNSMGMIRRSLWEEHPFDESLPTAEDYAWTLEQLKRGHLCHRLALPFSYQRSGHHREREFARIVFHFARQHRLRVTWLGPIGSLKHLAHARLRRLLQRHAPADADPGVQARLTAWWQARNASECAS